MGQTVNLLAMPTVVRIHHCPQIIIAGIAQSIEHQPSKLRVAGLSPVSRSRATKELLLLKQQSKHCLEKDIA